VNCSTRVNIRASSRASCISRLLSHKHDNCSVCRSSTDSEPHTPSSAGRSAMAPQCIMSSRSLATRWLRVPSCRGSDLVSPKSWSTTGSTAVVGSRQPCAV
jgi:hypothetical protein